MNNISLYLIVFLKKTTILELLFFYVNFYISDPLTHNVLQVHYLNCKNILWKEYEVNYDQVFVLLNV